MVTQIKCGIKRTQSAVGAKIPRPKVEGFLPPPWTSWWVNCAIPTAHVVSLYNPQPIFGSANHSQAVKWEIFHESPADSHHIKLWESISTKRVSYFYDNFMVLIFMGARIPILPLHGNLFTKIGCTDVHTYLTACTVGHTIQSQAMSHTPLTVHSHNARTAQQSISLQEFGLHCREPAHDTGKRKHQRNRFYFTLILKM